VAHARTWSAPREIALHRLARAEELGMTPMTAPNRPCNVVRPWFCELNESRTTMPVQGNRYPDEHMRRVGL
jgi:hypothetical protein